MKITKTKNATVQAIYIYILTIIAALVFSPLFSKLYNNLLNPPVVGYGFFWGKPEELIVGGIIFSYIFFLSFFIFIFMTNRKWLVWLIGIILPAIIILPQGKKYIYLFLTFTIIGAILGWVVILIYQKIKK